MLNARRPRQGLDTTRILADNEYICNDTWITGINNNDVIIGPSGAGKTRGYVKPNILQANESMIIADTKGSLYHEMGDYLREKGFTVLNVDMTDPARSYGYNPIDYIRYDPEADRYNEQDIFKMCSLLSPLTNARDPFWDNTCRAILCAFVSFVLERLPREEHNLASAFKLFHLADDRLVELFMDLEADNPDSLAVRQYNLVMKSLPGAKQTYSCVRAELGEKLSSLTLEGSRHMFTARERVSFRDMGKRRTALFLSVSDTDRSMDRLSNLFYAQALQALCNSADNDYPDHRLPVPVRIILDDFATNVYIPDFDKIISVIRSREIYVSIILQSISQLESLYGSARASTILNNCDHCLYLGGQDVETARYISVKANCRMDTVLNMPLDDAYLFTRGSRPRKVSKFRLERHECYAQLIGADASELSRAAG